MDPHRIIGIQVDEAIADRRRTTRTAQRTTDFRHAVKHCEPQYVTQCGAHYTPHMRTAMHERTYVRTYERRRLPTVDLDTWPNARRTRDNPTQPAQQSPPTGRTDQRSDDP
jgi:hypothetical protein